MTYDIIIIGAGPAGLYAAIEASKKNKSILILEKQPTCGQKLLLSGSGQCNFTNKKPIRDFLHCYGDHGRFLKHALLSHTNEDVIAFFEHHDVPAAIVETNGKVFPKTRKAMAILQVLLDQLDSEKVTLNVHSPVRKVSQQDSLFSVSVKQDVFQSKALLIATGGRSFPETGSTGDGYDFARSLGHAITAIKPGLTSFDITDYSFTQLSGTSFESLPVSLWHKNKKIKTLSGPMVLTHSGLSGPVIHHLSRFASKGDELQLHLFGSTNEEKHRAHWNRLLSQNQSKPIHSILKYFPISRALADTILDLSGLNKLSRIVELSKKDLSSLFLMIYGYKMEIKSLGDFKKAMVTVGGVHLKEVQTKTMESKLVPNLYFAGEVLDIDGDSGGFDLQACWSTGYLAGTQIGLK